METHSTARLRNLQFTFKIALPELQWRPLQNFWYWGALHNPFSKCTVYIQDCATRAAITASKELLVWGRATQLACKDVAGATLVPCAELLARGGPTQLTFEIA